MAAFRTEPAEALIVVSWQDPRRANAVPADIVDVPAVLDASAWCAAPQLRDSVADALRVCAEHDVEGIVAKRVDSPYRPGERSSDWLRLKSADWRTAHLSRRHGS